MSEHLESVTITGYKSIRELRDFPLHKDINLLIGANGSGKSNFIQFFELLGHMMDRNKGLQNYVSARGRADAFLFRGMHVTPELSAHLRFGRNEYKFTLRAAGDRSLFFAHESAPFEDPDFGWSKNNQGSGHVESRLFESPSSSEQWVIDTISRWRVYHFHDTSPSAAVMGLHNVVDNQVLQRDAANLAPFLWQMSRQSPREYEQIIATVRQVAPFFGEFVFREISPGQTQLLWKDRYSDLIYYPYQLSDGTLRFICLATLLLQPQTSFQHSAATLIIDEPELGLHPSAIHLLASLMHEAAQRFQLIVSTQSSLLLDQFEPEHAIVVDCRDGESILSRPEPEQVGEWLQEYTLGQLWEKNHLGGYPDILAPVIRGGGRRDRAQILRNSAQATPGAV
ncbi:MAG: AAA family ATPase [Haliangiales bacterium]